MKIPWAYLEVVQSPLKCFVLEVGFFLLKTFLKQVFLEPVDRSLNTKRVC